MDEALELEDRAVVDDPARKVRNRYPVPTD
jgi:hypothetical protein